MLRIAAFDLSLTETGVAYRFGGERQAYTIPTGKRRGPERLAFIRDDLMALVRRVSPRLVVIEQAGRMLKGPATGVIELHGVISVALWEAEIPVVYPAPARLKKFTTGKGNADKSAMMAGAIRAFAYPGSNENEADAWCLHAMGEAAYLDRSGLPQYRLEAVQDIEWPEVAA